jgi:Uma2 family endonuclease
MSDMPSELVLRPFTVDEYHRMVEAGVLDAQERVELIDGAIVEMSPIGENHWGRHLAIVTYLVRVLGDRAAVAGQASLPLRPRDEPQPDVAILAPRRYGPGPSFEPRDLLAAIEIADSSLRTDLGPKLLLYARHRVPDYLVVDVRHDVLLHHRQPHDLRYGLLDRLGARGTFTLTALPDVVLDAGAFLG